MKKTCAFIFGVVTMLSCIWSPMLAAATKADTHAAIEKGLAHLHRSQRANGSWAASGNEQAATAAAAFAFLSNAERWRGNEAEYQAAVDRAITFLVGSATATSVGMRGDGVGVCPGEASSCRAVYWFGNSRSIQTTALAAAAIAAYGQRVGSHKVAAQRGPLAGLTWREIGQAINNAVSANQSVRIAGNSGGRWGDFIPANSDPDGSGTPWAVMALAFSESIGASSADAVRSDVSRWLGTSQRPDGSVCFASDGSDCSVADTGGWLLAMRFAGLPADNPQIKAAVEHLNRGWRLATESASQRGFGGADRMWWVYMGLESTLGVADRGGLAAFRAACTSDENGGLVLSDAEAGCNWAHDLTRVAIEHQRADGSWPGASVWDDPVAGAMYLSILGGAHVPIVRSSCPTDERVWRASQRDWPITTLTLGGQAYSMTEAMAILAATDGVGATASPISLLSSKLIAAKLNLASGSDPQPIVDALDRADELLQQLNDRLPNVTGSGSLSANQIEELVNQLNAYNSGSMTTGCVDAMPVPGTDRVESSVVNTREPASTVVSPGFGSGKSINLMAEANAAKPLGSFSKLRPHLRKGITALVISKDGNALATASTDKEVRIWDANTGRELKALKGTTGLPTALAFGPDGSKLASVGSDSVLRIWNTNNGKQTAALQGHEHGVRALALSPDGKFAASSGEDTRVMIWDLKTEKLTRILHGAADFVNSLDFSPDSRSLAVAGEDGRILIFNVANGKLLHTLRGHAGAIDAISFSPDGRFLASAGQDTVVRLWDPVQGTPRQLLKGHANPVRTVAFSPDGKSLASGGEDTRVILWNAASGAIGGILQGSNETVSAVVFSGKGPYLAVANEAGELAVWNTQSRAKSMSVLVPKSK